jgi:hypothetical protein
MTSLMTSVTCRRHAEAPTIDCTWGGGHGEESNTVDLSLQSSSSLKPMNMPRISWRGKLAARLHLMRTRMRFCFWVVLSPLACQNWACFWSYVCTYNKVSYSKPQNSVANDSERIIANMLMQQGFHAMNVVACFSPNSFTKICQKLVFD